MLTKLLKNPETLHGGDNHSLAGKLNGGNSAETLRWQAAMWVRGKVIVPLVSTRQGDSQSLPLLLLRFAFLGERLRVNRAAKSVICSILKRASKLLETMLLHNFDH